MGTLKNHFDIRGTQLHSEACQGNRARVEQILNTHPELVEFIPQLFRSVIGNSNDGVLDLLIARCNLDERNWGLKAAVDYQRADLIERLIPISRPKTERSHILTQAVASRNLEAVRVLLPHCNAKAGHSLALQSCFDIRDDDLRKALVDLLYPVSNPRTALKYLHEKSDGWAQLKQKVDDDHMKVVLRSETKEFGQQPQRRKI